MTEPKQLGRKPNLELLSLSEREKIREQAQGDPAEYKRLLMVATRAAKKRSEVSELTSMGRHVTRDDAGQLSFLGEEFDAELQDEDMRQALRRRAQTDLWFLCVDVFDMPLTEFCHRRITDMLPKFDPDLPFNQQGDAINGHDFDLYFPRGSMKSSIYIKFAIQFTLCFPEERILFLAGAKGLPAKMLKQYRDHFVVENNKPSKFQQLFPEFCILPNEVYENSYTVPFRKNLMKLGEPTAEARSNETTNSGFHYELFLSDDLVDNDNSQNPTQLAKADTNFYINLEMKVNHGLLLVAGTRYDVADVYGKRMAKPHADYHVVCSAAMWTNPELPADRRVQLEKDLRNPQIPSSHFVEDDWILLLPSMISFKVLMKKRTENMKAFAGQQLMDPVAAGGQVQFTRELLRSITVNPAQLPQGGKVFGLWDLAYSTKRGSAYTVGSIVRVDARGRLILLDAIRGKFETHVLVHHIVDLNARWQPEVTSIENSMGAKWLLGDLQREAMRRGVKLNIDWFPIDNSDDAKDGRVFGMEAYMTSRRLLLNAGLEQIEVLYEELERWGKLDHKDYADNLALQVVKRMPPLFEAGDDAEVQAAYRELKEKDLKDHLYGLGVYEEVEAPAPVEVDAYELEPCLGGLRG